MTDCDACGQPTPPGHRAHLCPTCTTRMHAQLRGIPDLLRLLGDAVARLDRVDRDTTRTGPHHPDDQDDDHGRATSYAIGTHPLPIDLDAAGATTTITRTIRATAARLDPRAAGTPPVLAIWLARRTHHIARLDWAATACRDIHRATTAGWARVDQPPARWYAGTCDTPVHWPDTDCGCPCHTIHGIDCAGACDHLHHGTCGTELYGTTPTALITCPGCGTTHQAADRREWLIASAGPLLLTAAEAATALTSLQHPVSPTTIRVWRHRGILEPTDVNPKGQPLYRLADVREALRRDTYGIPGRTA